LTNLHTHPIVPHLNPLEVRWTVTDNCLGYSNIIAMILSFAIFLKAVHQVLSWDYFVTEFLVHVHHEDSETTSHRTKLWFWFSTETTHWFLSQSDSRAMSSSRRLRSSSTTFLSMHCPSNSARLIFVQLYKAYYIMSNLCLSSPILQTTHNLVAWYFCFVGVEPRKTNKPMSFGLPYRPQQFREMHLRTLKMIILCPRLGVEWIGRISWLPRAPLGPIFMTGLPER